MTIKEKKTLTLLGIIALILVVGIGTIVVVTRLSTTEESVAPTAPESTPKAAEWYGSQACNTTFTIPQPEVGRLTVCNIVMDPQGVVVDGSLAPDASFSEVVNTSLAADTSTALSLNGDVLLGDGVFDTECVTFEDLPFGTYDYAEEVLTSSGTWVPPQYYDFLLPSEFIELSDFELYQTSATSDGTIALSSQNSDVTLVVLNSYAPASCNNGCSVSTDCADGNQCIGGLCRNPECSAETDCTCDIVEIQASCNDGCSVNADCVDGNICSGGTCRNSSCVNEADCACAIATGTPTATTLPQCSDGVDNDGDGLIDCTPGAEDPGCYPDGSGGGGACNPNDNSEKDVTVAVTALPEAGISLPTLAALGGGVVMVLLGILLAL